MKKTDALIIMDGFAHSDDTRANAIYAQGTPNLKALAAQYPHTLLKSSGRDVGLPTGQMGNSEVGHLNLGAGRVVYQDITRIDKAIEDGSFFENSAFLGAIENCKKHGTALHLAGLLSDGGVHSMNTHLYALLRLAKTHGLKDVFVHCICDGRDTPPQSAAEFVEKLQRELAAIGTGRIATVIGRYYFMDRDNRWDRVEKAYNCVFDCIGTEQKDALAAVRESYQNGISDEFIEPVYISGYTGVKENDSMILFNFRSDRAREISRAVLYKDFAEFERAGGYKKIYYAGMTQYDAEFKDIHTAFAPKSITNTLGEWLAKNGKTQTRIAETEKYAHVTFFFNGGAEQPNENESRVLVPSPKVKTYDMQPEMSAQEVTERALEVIGKTDVLILNLANCDMVGHTGMFDAAVKAVQTVDECIKKLVDKILETGGSAIITSDHGNAEYMSFEDGSPMTAHTTNPVPLILASNQYKTARLSDGGALCDVAPTLLKLIGISQPQEMDGKSLI